MKQLIKSFFYLSLLVAPLASLAGEQDAQRSCCFNNNGCGNDCFSNNCGGCNNNNSCHNDCNSGCCGEGNGNFSRDCCDNCNFSCSNDCGRFDRRNDCCSNDRGRDCGRDCGQDCNSECNRCHSYFWGRPVGRNLARLDSNPNFWFLPNREPHCMDFAFTFEYQRTRREHRINRCLFGGRDQLVFAGQNAFDRQDGDFRAEEFGLASDFRGAFSPCPRIENFIFDFNFQWEFGDWFDCLDNLYFRINLPVVHSRWRLGVNDCCDCRPSDTGNTFFPPCQFAEGAVTPTHSLSEALSGDFTFGDKNRRDEFGRVRFCRQSRTDLANLDLILGWNFWNCDTYRIGAYLLTVAPTARRGCHDRFFFAPVNTDNRHWQLGGGLQAYWDLWNCGDDHNVTLMIDGYATHLFRHCDHRSFDFARNGCFSRYLLLKEFNANNNFTGNLVRAIDAFNTRTVDSKVDVQGEFLLQFIWRHCGWSAGLGYNLYGRSCEKLCFRENCDFGQCGSRFGINGCTGVCARNFIPGTGLIGSSQVLNATASDATFTSCGTVDNAVLLEDTTTNIFGLAFNSLTDPFTPITDLTIAEASEIDSASSPVFVTTNDLDLRSGASPSLVSHKLFGHVNYTLPDCDWAPFVGVGAEVEWGSCRRCCSPDQWGVWVKTGVTF